MNLTKKNIASAALAAIFLLISSSCNFQKQTNEFVEIKPSDEPVTITISWWGDDSCNKATLKAIELFETSHTNITVEKDYGEWNGWKQKLTDDINNDTAADIMQINFDWLNDMSYNGTGFYDLELLNQNLNLSGLSHDILKYGKRNNIINAVPFSITGISLFYNEDKFKELNVSVPETWDDLFDAANVFKKKNCYPLNLDNGSGYSAWYVSVIYIQQKTGKQFITAAGKLGFSIDDIADALEFYQSLIDSGVIPSIQTQKNSSLPFYENEEFTSGKIAGICDWNDEVKKYEDALDDGKLIAGKPPVCENALMTGWFTKPSTMLAVNKNSQHPYEASLLLDFLLNNPDCAKILGTTRGIPACEYALDALKNTDKLKGNMYDAANELLDINPCVINPLMENPQMQSYYNDALEAVSYGILTPHQAAEGMYANIVYTLNRIR